MADIGLEEQRAHPARIKVPTKRFIEMCIVECEREVSHYALYGTETVEPLSMTEALESPDADKWKAAVQEEYDALMQPDIWSLIPLPPRRSTIGSKWAFKVKYNAQREVDHYKCRLVPQGFGQQPGLDYIETFLLWQNLLPSAHSLPLLCKERCTFIRWMSRQRF